MEKGIRNTLPRPCRGCCSGLCHGDAGIGAGRQYARGSCQFSLAVPKRTGAPAKGGARVVRKNAPPYGALCAKPSSLKGSRYLARTGCTKYVPNHFAIWRTHEVVVRTPRRPTNCPSMLGCPSWAASSPRASCAWRTSPVLYLRAAEIVHSQSRCPRASVVPGHEPELEDDNAKSDNEGG